MNNSPKSTSLQEFEGTLHLVFSSHWDREWYLPFQAFRAKLVTLLDEVLAQLESGALPHYQMDGQWVPIEDYLEIRPEKEDLIRRLVQEGKLAVGPWYDLPDEFLVSGESVARNFLLGMKRSEKFGQTARVGWLCDIFGHNSQMPQVLSQLGIDNAILWRGVRADSPNPFHWQGADGTRIIVHRFGHDGYTDFDFQVRRAPHRDEIPDVEGLVQYALDYFPKSYEVQGRPNTMLWFDGGDHMLFDPRIVEMAHALNEKCGREVVKVSTLDHFLAAWRDEAKKRQDVIEGELREPLVANSAGWLIPGVASSRIDLKRANHAGETLLTLWAEPWCDEAARVLNLEYPSRALELAWEYLLKNHPHDSICGCSIDDTHNSMPYRFDQSRQLCEVHLNRAFNALSAQALSTQLSPKTTVHEETLGEDLGGESEVAPLDKVTLQIEEKAFGFSLFAPAAGSAQPQPEALLKLPAGWPQFNEFFGFESKPAFRIFNENGEEVPYQLLQAIPATIHTHIDRNKFPGGGHRQGARIVLDTVLQAGEAQHFRVERAGEPTRFSMEKPLGVARDTLRNEKLEVRAHHDGTLSLKCLQSGAEYSGLLQMEDSADIGDGWYHGVALQDCGFLSTGGNVTFGLMENGPLLARLKIRVEWLVPRDFDFKNFVRSQELAPLVVEHTVTLRRDSDFVEVQSTVHNTVRDHRLRLLCPTNFQNLQTFFADTPYDCVERAVKLRADNHLSRELQVEMTPQQNFVAASTQEGGLALLSPGQYESAVLDEDGKPLCVTLLRGFRRTVFTDGEEGGQILGKHTIRMAIKPFQNHGKAKLPANELLRDAQALAAPARCIFLDADDIAEWKREKEFAASLREHTAPDEAAPQWQGDAVLSARLRCEQSGALVLRLFNAESTPREVQLSGANQWQRTNLRGENAETISGALTLQPKEIVTLRAS